MQTAEDKVLAMLGLCARARKLVIGVPSTCEAVRTTQSKRVYLVVEAADTSAPTHKKLTDKCAYYKVPLIRLHADGASLAHALGKSAVTGAACVTDASLYEAVMKALKAAAYPVESLSTDMKYENLTDLDN